MDMDQRPCVSPWKTTCERPHDEAKDKDEAAQKKGGDTEKRKKDNKSTGSIEAPDKKVIAYSWIPLGCKPSTLWIVYLFQTQVSINTLFFFPCQVFDEMPKPKSVSIFWNIWVCMSWKSDGRRHAFYWIIRVGWNKPDCNWFSWFSFKVESCLGVGSLLNFG